MMIYGPVPFCRPLWVDCTTGCFVSVILRLLGIQLDPAALYRAVVASEHSYDYHNANT